MVTETGMPVKKVAIGGAAGVFVTVLVLILNAYVPLFIARPISGELAAGLTNRMTEATSQSAILPDSLALLYGRDCTQYELKPLVIGPAIGLSERNAKIRHGGYREAMDR